MADKVKHKDAESDEKKRYDEVGDINLALVGEHDFCKNNAKNGCGEGENRDLGHGIVLKKHAPECVGNRRKCRKVKKDKEAVAAGKVNSAAEGEADDCHDGATEHELIARDNDGILFSRIFLHKNR